MPVIDLPASPAFCYYTTLGKINFLQRKDRVLQTTDLLLHITPMFNANILDLFVTFKLKCRLVVWINRIF